MTKIGIIGLGNMGQLHGRLLLEREGVEVFGVTDLNQDRSKEIANEFKCKSFENVDALLDSGIDMVFITVPNTQHAILTIKALEKGITVFVEKPLATSLEDAKKVVETSKRTGKTVYVGYNRRFAPVYTKAKELVSDPTFKPVSSNIIQNDGDMQNPPWLTDVKMTGGFMYDTTVHFLDMGIFLLGDITEVRALGKAFFYPIIDDFTIQLKYKNGSYGVITSNGHSSWISPFERVQICGDHKSIITEELDEIAYSPSLGGIIEGENYSKLEHNDKWGYTQMHEHIFDCMKTGKTPINGLNEGYKVVELIEACYQSAKGDGEIIKF